MKLKRMFNMIVWIGAAVAIFVLVTNIYVHLASRAYIYKTAEGIKEKETALILGAAIFQNGTLSPIFKDRVDKASELYKAGKVSKILVSGDNSSVSHNEVSPVRTYLLGKNIPDENIFLDHAGFDTYSTMYRAREIFKVSSVIIVTQDFHLPRAVFIARALGLDAYGVSADEGQAAMKNYVREIFANEKAAIDLIVARKPKFLGEEIPITGVQDKAPEKASQ